MSKNRVTGEYSLVISIRIETTDSLKDVNFYPADNDAKWFPLYQFLAFLFSFAAHRCCMELATLSNSFLLSHEHLKGLIYLWLLLDYTTGDYFDMCDTLEEGLGMSLG